MKSAPATSDSSPGLLRRLYRFVAKRHFVASRDELMAEGFSASRIKNWQRTGRLIKILRSVYSYGRDVDSRESVWRASLAAAGPGSVLTGRSACEAWGIVKPKTRLPRVVLVITNLGNAVTLPGLSPALRNTEVKMVRRQIRPKEIRSRNGLDLVRPALALIEFSASASDREVRFAFLEACRLGLFNERDLKYCARRLIRRRGAKRLRPYLTLWVPELACVRSVFEGWFLLEWLARKLPNPKVNEKIFGFEVDFYWPEFGVILELDGDSYHRGPVQRKLDLEKQKYLEARGLTVIRVTYKEFEADPAAVIERVLKSLGLA